MPFREVMQEANITRKFDPNALQAAREEAFKIIDFAIKKYGLPGMSVAVSVDGQVVFKTGELRLCSSLTRLLNKLQQLTSV